MSEPFVRISKISKDFNMGETTVRALAEVDLELDQNSFTVLMGPSGSGKSTLLKTVAGLTSIYRGRITLNGNTVSDLQPHEVARMGVAYLPQTQSTFTHLSVRENLAMAGYTVPPKDFEERLSRGIQIFPKLSTYMNTKVSNLSGGERQMVAMTMALLRNPSVIMFDEPTANLAPIVATQVLNVISQISKDITIATLLVEQNATRALQIGHIAYLLVNGKVAFQGTTKELLEHKELGRLYLGLGDSEETKG